MTTSYEAAMNRFGFTAETTEQVSEESKPKTVRERLEEMKAQVGAEYKRRNAEMDADAKAVYHRRKMRRRNAMLGHDAQLVGGILAGGGTGYVAGSAVMSAIDPTGGALSIAAGCVTALLVGGVTSVATGAAMEATRKRVVKF